MADQVPAEVSGFTEVPHGGLDPKILGSHNETILNLAIRDKKQKLTARKVLGTILVVLLIAQNIAVSLLICFAYTSDKLNSLTPVISVVCSATLVETAAIVHTMVKWIFSESDFKIVK